MRQTGILFLNPGTLVALLVPLMPLSLPTPCQATPLGIETEVNIGAHTTSLVKAEDVIKLKNSSIHLTQDKKRRPELTPPGTPSQATLHFVWNPATHTLTVQRVDQGLNQQLPNNNNPGDIYRIPVDANEFVTNKAIIIEPGERGATILEEKHSLVIPTIVPKVATNTPQRGEQTPLESIHAEEKPAAPSVEARTVPAPIPAVSQKLSPSGIPTASTGEIAPEQTDGPASPPPLAPTEATSPPSAGAEPSPNSPAEPGAPVLAADTAAAPNEQSSRGPQPAQPVAPHPQTEQALSGNAAPLLTESSATEPPTPDKPLEGKQPQEDIPQATPSEQLIQTPAEQIPALKTIWPRKRKQAKAAPWVIAQNNLILAQADVPGTNNINIQLQGTAATATTTQTTPQTTRPRQATIPSRNIDEAINQELNGNALASDLDAEEKTALPDQETEAAATGSVETPEDTPDTRKPTPQTTDHLQPIPQVVLRPASRKKTIASPELIRQTNLALANTLPVDTAKPNTPEPPRKADMDGGTPQKADAQQALPTPKEAGNQKQAGKALAPAPPAELQLIRPAGHKVVIRNNPTARLAAMQASFKNELQKALTAGDYQGADVVLHKAAPFFSSYKASKDDQGLDPQRLLYKLYQLACQQADRDRTAKLAAALTPEAQHLQHRWIQEMLQLAADPVFAARYPAAYFRALNTWIRFSRQVYTLHNTWPGRFIRLDDPVDASLLDQRQRDLLAADIQAIQMAVARRELQATLDKVLEGETSLAEIITPESVHMLKLALWIEKVNKALRQRAREQSAY